MRIGVLSSVLSFSALQAAACELALALAVDISGSVDAGKYHVQMDGIAAGLRDPIVSQALVSGKMAVMLVQWAGEGRQYLSVPWRRIGTFEDVEALATHVETISRAWERDSTAIGEALRYTTGHFADVLDCTRLVIDVSGDGASNEGPPPEVARPALAAAEITVNALVISGVEPGVIEYYRDRVIFGRGAFLMVAGWHIDFPEKMRRKLQRETALQFSQLRLPGDRDHTLDGRDHNESR